MTEVEFVRQARWFAERRGYKASWPYVVFKDKYGRWPGPLLKDGDPMPVTDEFMEWVFGYWKQAEMNRNKAQP